MGVDILGVDILGVDILGVHILGVDILGVDILGVDILRLILNDSLPDARMAPQVTHAKVLNFIMPHALEDFSALRQ